jgi:hypothetical protein
MLHHMKRQNNLFFSEDIYVHIYICYRQITVFFFSSAFLYLFILIVVYLTALSVTQII